MYNSLPLCTVQMSDMQTNELLTIVIAALEDLKAIDIKVLNVEDLTSITDKMVICSGRSTRHVKSIADNVVTAIKAKGLSPLGLEGLQESEWVLVDLGDIIIHVMLPDIREYYHLEKLWTFQTNSH